MKDDKKQKTQKPKTQDATSMNYAQNNVTSDQTINNTHNVKKESQGQNTKR